MEVKCYGGPYNGMTLNVPDGRRYITTIVQTDPISYMSIHTPPTHITPSSIDVPIERFTYGYGDNRAPDEHVAFWPDGEHLRKQWEAVLDLKARDFELEIRWTDIALAAELSRLEKVIEELESWK